MANPQQVIQIVKERPQIMIGVGVAVIGLILLLVFINPFGGGSSGNNPCETKLDSAQRDLVSVPDAGRAIEVQAILARENIVVDRVELDGGKSKLVFRDNATICDRDRALLTVVQSGLMDKNMGLEAFDKGDLTASREEKRIKLIRAQQGELSRLIRKMDPVEDATVSLSIPEPSIFKDSKHPMSASVQVSLPSGMRLTQSQVRAIINLIVGSIQGISADHVALSDTNGNTYNSVLGPDDELGSKLQEQDNYMRQKVASQLDKLVGAGHYVVTVSTQLRETTIEKMTRRYDPNESVVQSKQQFSERLSSENEGVATGGMTTTYVPKEMTTMVVDPNGAESRKGYRRSGEEISYANTQSQTLETIGPGIVEDISIAVTIDDGHYPQTVDADGQPQDMNNDDLKRLIARSASPKVQLDSVSIARIGFGGGVAGNPLFGDDDSSSASGAGISSQPDWWLWLAIGGGSLLALIIVAGLISALNNRTQQSSGLQAEEIQRLQEMARQQQEQLARLQQQQQSMPAMQSGQRPNANPSLTTNQSAMPPGMPPRQPQPVAAGNNPMPDMTAATMPIGGTVTPDGIPLAAGAPMPEVGANETAAMELQQTLDDLGLALNDEDADDAALQENIDDWMKE
jgi:flagellar basal-body M-ring protein/flagellar hook-basal body protein fliF